MDLIFSFFPLFVVAIIALSLWSLYEQNRFTRFEGKLKRGVMVWAEPLSWEIRQFLESMPHSIRHDRSFIRKEGREILIAEERSGWSLFARRKQWSYVGYINLSTPESRIEFRLPWSVMFSMIFVFLIFLPVFFSLSSGALSGNGSLIFLECLFPLIFLAIFAGSVLFSHYRERKRLLNILNQANVGRASGYERPFG